MSFGLSKVLQNRRPNKRNIIITAERQYDRNIGRLQNIAKYIHTLHI